MTTALTSQHSELGKSKKSVSFNPQNNKVDIDDEGNNDWQNELIDKLEKRIESLLQENVTLKKQLQSKNYDLVYKENQLMQLELKNMYGIQEENKDLKEEMQKLKSFSYD